MLQRFEREYVRRFSARALVLMYHRIATPNVDPWGLCVSRENFISQLDAIIASGVAVVPLSELAASIPGRRAGRRSLVITFDDGYYDNYAVAEPALGERSLPATLFATSDHISASQTLWWDRLVAIFLTPGRLPEQVVVTIGGVTKSWSLKDAAHLSFDEAERLRDWTPSQGLPTARHKVMLDLWAILVKRESSEREAAMRCLSHWAEADCQTEDPARTMRADELVDLATKDRWTIGAHGKTHRSMFALTDDELRCEMESSRDALAGILARPVSALSYPQGHWDQRVVESARAAGFSIGCTSEVAAVTARFNPMAIPRIAVPNIPGDALMDRLRFFMALD